MKTFGQTIRAKRKELNKTLKEVAQYTGMSIAHISDIEHGYRHVPKEDTIKLFSEYLQIDYAELLILKIIPKIEDILPYSECMSERIYNFLKSELTGNYNEFNK